MIVLEQLFIFACTVFLLSQIIIPPWIGKPIFWLFRKPSKKKEELQTILADTEAAKDLSKIRKRIDENLEEVSKIYPKGNQYISLVLDEYSSPPTPPKKKRSSTPKKSQKN